jgi:NAD(P) transhydrogenase subunit beta
MNSLTYILVQVSYLLSIIFFIVGLKRLSSPATARSGNQLAAVGMFLGVVGVLIGNGVLGWPFIISGIVIGSLIGIVLAKKIEMTAMPEMVALLNGFGGIASAFVAIAEFYRSDVPESLGAYDLSIMGFSILVGFITFTGSLLAFGKLRGIVTGRAVTYSGQQIVNSLLGLITIGSIVMFTMAPSDPTWMYIIILGSLILGVVLVIPIGGADMPVVISLLNSYSGVAASATGFVLNDNLLIIAGALVGASGLILTNIMCKAMNRSLGNVLFGAFGSVVQQVGAETDGGSKTIRQASAEDVAVMTSYAQKVIIVPGYGLAVAQAQHSIREAAEILERKGVDVRYAIHPVAGRMPGHMNVLLAEANVPYDQLYDMDEINSEFESTDVVLVIGANDVVNPAARSNPASPIYGMPILDVDKAKSVVVFKRSMSPGFAGIDNDLFYLPNTYMYFGDAKKSIMGLISALKEV